MSETMDTQVESIVSMYRDGVSLRTLEIAFGRTAEEIIRVLHDAGAVRRLEGENWDAFVARIREDVKHAA